jgi:deoxyribodipyrimidine photolyase-related protein
MEDPVFYGDRKGNKQGLPVRLKLNQLRICYQLASVEIFVKNIQAANIFQKVTHISFDNIFQNKYNVLNFVHESDSIHAFDPEDHLLKHRLQSSGLKIIFHESPSFIMSQKDIDMFMSSRSGTRLQHSLFFDAVKKKINYLKDTKSQDALNRKAFHKNETLPELPYPSNLSISYTDSQWTELWTSVAKHPFFKSHTKPINKERAMAHLKQLPLCSKDAKAWLTKFVTERFGSFGKYEDAIVSNSSYLFHSGISTFINNGLLVPIDVLSVVKSTITHIQNKEAFVRQLFGWREYSRLYYRTVGKETYLKNVFGMKKQSLGKEWFSAKTGIPIVDQAIIDAFDMGYLHHIRRLMVMSNYMMLSEVHPDAIYKWMYEFSLDSWDWVMVFNCYSMASWSDGGFGMRKPYISSASYLMKMSDEPRGVWEAAWNQKFRNFLENHRDVLQHTPYASLL